MKIKVHLALDESGFSVCARPRDVFSSGGLWYASFSAVIGLVCFEIANYKRVKAKRSEKAGLGQ